MLYLFSHKGIKLRFKEIERPAWYDYWYMPIIPAPGRKFKDSLGYTATACLIKRRTGVITQW
jgi:hypothetical protein